MTKMVKDLPSAPGVAHSEYVSGIMSTDVKIIDGNNTMMDAARTMGQYHIGSLLVKGSERPEGIVTESDFLARVIAANKDPKKVKVFEVMSPRLITIKPQSTVKEAAQTMIKENSRLVVFEGGNLVGIITASDLIKSISESSETEMPVSRFMTKLVVTGALESKVIDVAKKMGKERIGSIILMKDGKPWGIFTERDLLSKIPENEKRLEKRVGIFSSFPLITVAPKCSISKAAAIMVKKHVRRLPVIERSEMVGIITARDLVEAFAA